ncbi:MAG: beta-hydroxyacyl-ACP dehydratase [Prevotellaceae bacterium]|jgi:3-hydroxyacyl-[acyl-carrier-protein] dehydratase|nr:beta-hydroxyacyl-ACP dehydratase [Prevotellaceae bacterium]
MQLINDFYRVETATGGDTEFEYRIALNREHFIYRAHFPGNPITPGVCIIQLCKELMELRVKKPLFLKKILNVKFLSVVDPTIFGAIQVAFSKVAISENGCAFSAAVHSGATQLAKLSLAATIL